MRERASLPLSARLLILSTAAAGAFALGVRVADASSWTTKDVLAFAALTVAIAVAEQFSIPLRHRTETVNFSLTDGLWAAALPLASPSVLTFSVAAGVLIGQVARRWAPMKIAFNVSQFVIGISMAEIVFPAQCSTFSPSGGRSTVRNRFRSTSETTSTTRFAFTRK
jgi:hypothetical protein